MAVFAVTIGLAGQAVACASCGCGVPTLTASGSEVPFAGRLRFSSVIRGWGEDSGTAGVNSQSIRELRMDLGTSYAVLPWLVLSATLPIQSRELNTVSLLHESSTGLGDVAIGARAILFRDRDFAPTFLLSGLVGTTLPTGPLQRTASGQSLSVDSQLGAGAFAPGAGLSISHFRGDFSFFGWVYASVPFRGYLDYRIGPTVRTSAVAQYQPTMRWAFRAGPEAVVQWRGDVNGAPDDHHGTTFYAGADAIFSATPDALIQLGVRVPFLQTAVDAPRPSPVLNAALFLDI